MGQRSGLPLVYPTACEFPNETRIQECVLSARRFARGLAPDRRWSPKDAKLSVWLTFEAPYSLGHIPNAMVGRDPAAILDVPTGKLHWQPVNAREKAQLAHDCLRQRDYAEAWRRYSEIENDP